MESGRILDDAYILTEGVWKELKVLSSPGLLVGAKTAVCGETVFLYGGEICLKEGDDPIPNTKLFKLKVN